MYLRGDAYKEVYKKQQERRNLIFDEMVRMFICRYPFGASVKKI